MPTYDYICEKCKQRFEHFQSMSSEPLKNHPECNGNVKRIVSGGTGLIFKGSGFYLTDYKKDRDQQFIGLLSGRSGSILLQSLLYL